MYKNNMQKNSCNCGYVENNNDYYENTCPYMQNPNNYMCDSCECGFDEEESLFPENPMLAQSYVPWQNMGRTFIPCVGLKMGTIFPELVSPYMPGQSQEEIEYIRRNNEIKEGCNKC